MKKNMIKLYCKIRYAISTILNFLLEMYDFFFFQIKMEDADVFPTITEKKVCIVVPHVDDEILGMGGLLTSLDYNNNDILIIYTTDGCKSYHPNYNEELMKKKRKEEAEKVKKFFMNTKILFLENKSMEWDINKSKKKLFDEIMRFSPQYIFFPAEFDRNMDHVKNAICLGMCLKGILLDIRTFSFCVQTPIIHPTHYYPMSKPDMDKKIACLEYYDSQKVMKKSFKKIIFFNKLCTKKYPGNEIYGIEIFKEFNKAQILSLSDAKVSRLNRNFPILTNAKSIERVTEKCRKMMNIK